MRKKDEEGERNESSVDKNAGQSAIQNNNDQASAKLN